MMSEASLDRLLIMFSAGLGLMVVGGLNLLLNGLSRRVRISIVGIAAMACALAPLSISSAQVSAISISAILLGLGALVVFSSSLTSSLFQSAATFVRRPSVHACILIGSGITMMAGSLTHFDSEEEVYINGDMDWMAEACARPPLHDSSDVKAETDLGSPIKLKTPDEARSQSAVDLLEKQVLISFTTLAERFIRSKPASDMCNCHGWVFSGGRFWLSPEDVEQILNDNGYQAVSDPRAGDVVIYRQGTFINHSAVVHSVTPAGLPLVEGKWGWMGVFIHGINDSPYGRVHEFYRSSRPGHLFRGLDDHLYR